MVNFIGNRFGGFRGEPDWEGPKASIQVAKNVGEQGFDSIGIMGVYLVIYR